MNLNGLSVPYEVFDGQLRLAFMPYHTVYLRIVYDRLEADEPSEHWHYSKGAYAVVTGSMVRCEALVDESKLTPEAKGFLYFWKQRTGNIVEDYNLFIQCVSLDSMLDVQQAYNATRMKLPQAAEELHVEKPDPATDPEGLSAGGKRSKKKSSR